MITSILRIIFHNNTVGRILLSKLKIGYFLESGGFLLTVNSKSGCLEHIRITLRILRNKSDLIHSVDDITLIFQNQ